MDPTSGSACSVPPCVCVCVCNSKLQNWKTGQLQDKSHHHRCATFRQCSGISRGGKQSQSVQVRSQSPDEKRRRERERKTPMQPTECTHCETQGYPESTLPSQEKPHELPLRADTPTNTGKQHRANSNRGQQPQKTHGARIARPSKHATGSKPKGLMD